MSGLDKAELDEDKQTTVEEGTRFKGTLQSTCRVVVRGVVDGELEAPSVDVAATGSVTGNVKAQSLQSSGVLAGHIDVDELFLSGSVQNDTVIRAKSLDVKLQSDSKLEVKFGECMLEVGEDPTLELGEASSGRSALKKGDKANARRADLTAAVDAASATSAAAAGTESSSKTDGNSTAST